MLLPGSQSPGRYFSLYSHLLEASNYYAEVESYAHLHSLMPSAPHIAHLPLHIYIRVGRLNDALNVNKTAIALNKQMYPQHHLLTILQKTQIKKKVTNKSKAMKANTTTYQVTLNWGGITTSRSEISRAVSKKILIFF